MLFSFQDIDKFGNEITQLARPLPVEYLIIDVSSRCAPMAASGGGRGKVRILTHLWNSHRSRFVGRALFLSSFASARRHS